MAWLTPGGVLSLHRSPAASLSSRDRQNRRSLQQRELWEVLSLFETLPVLSSTEKTSSILESLQQSFEEFAVRIIYAWGVRSYLLHLFRSFYFCVVNSRLSGRPTCLLSNPPVDQSEGDSPLLLDVRLNRALYPQRLRDPHNKDPGCNGLSRPGAHKHPQHTVL